LRLVVTGRSGKIQRFDWIFYPKYAGIFRIIKKARQHAGPSSIKQVSQEDEQPTFAARSAWWPAYRPESAAAGRGWQRPVRGSSGLHWNRLQDWSS
jgi:hypothetical protein